MPVAVIIISAAYFILYLFLYFGFRRTLHLKTIPDYFPFVTVLVAARNEENNITACLESLLKLNYPEDKLEIIVINDRSTDSTEQIVTGIFTEHNHCRLIHSSDNISNVFPGKANAIDCGIKESKGDIILATDADCSVPENWITEIVKYYQDETAMVCGYTRINHNNSFFNKLQSFDWLYLLSLAIYSSGYNMTMSCIGNNLSFRKSIYNNIGGYGNIEYSVTEDLALMRRINKLRNVRVIYPPEYLSEVKTDACKNLHELYNQKKRWFRGGVGINTLGYITGLLMYSTNLIMLTGLFFLPLYLYLISIGVKFTSDLLILLPNYRRFKYSGIVQYFIPFQFYFMLYGLLLPFTFLTGYKVNWKNRKV